MIIAAYPGAGKSTFAKQVTEAVDMPMIPCSHILSPAWKTNPELEPECRKPYHLRNPLFPDNYIADILRAEREYRFVLIPTNFDVIRRLQKDYKRKVLICHPDDDCREEYRARFLARSNSDSFRALFGHFWQGFFDPVWEYKRYDKWGGVYLAMGPGAHLTDLRQRLEEEQQDDTTQPVDDGTIRAIEEELADNLLLYLSGDDGCCFYSIRDLEASDEQEFLYETGRDVLEGSTDLVPVIAPRGEFKAESVEAFSTESRNHVREFMKKHMDWSSSCPTKRGRGDGTPSPERLEAARRREQIIYHRDYDPGNYPDSGLLYFSRISVDVVRQLVAEGLLDLQDRHNESPTVKEFLDFCSGEDEAIWFFHGFTVWPERIDSRVTLEGFESFAAPTPERTEEFLRFNRHGETEVLEDGACWCWYD